MSRRRRNRPRLSTLSPPGSGDHWLCSRCGKSITSQDVYARRRLDETTREAAGRLFVEAHGEACEEKAAPVAGTDVGTEVATLTDVAKRVFAEKAAEAEAFAEKLRVGQSAEALSEWLKTTYGI